MDETALSWFESVFRLPPMDTEQLLLVLNRARRRQFIIHLRTGAIFYDVTYSRLQVIYHYDRKQVRFVIHVPTSEGEQMLRVEGLVVHDVFLPEDAIDAEPFLALPAAVEQSRGRDETASTVEARP